MQLRRVTAQELREIYNSNKGAKCKRYLGISHYCNVPLIVKREKRYTVFTLSWFLKDDGNYFELIDNASKNDYCNLKMYEIGESYVTDIYVFDEKIDKFYRGNAVGKF